MKKLIVLCSLLVFTLVLFAPRYEVKAYETKSVETVECDLVNIDDVTIKITKAVINPIMIVEVEISYGNYCESLQDNVNICYETYYSQTALYNYDNLNDEVKPYSMFYDAYRYEQANIDNELAENNWYCSNNYLTKDLDFINSDGYIENGIFYEQLGTNYFSMPHMALLI